jgi:hypothetical protein
MSGDMCQPWGFGMVWTKLATAVGVCGALLALPAAAGLFTAHQAKLKAETSCRALRTSILATLDQNVDAGIKWSLVHKDLTEFERACALRDPEAEAVFSAMDRTILFTGASDAEQASSRRVRFVPPAPPFMGPPLGLRWPGLLPPPPPEEFRNRPSGT